MLFGLLRFVRSGALLAAACLAAMPSCKRCTLGSSSKAPPTPKLEPVPLEAIDQSRASRSKYRILLDERRLSLLRQARERSTPAWKYVQTRCDNANASAFKSGFHGFDWADVTASLALCWHATGEREYADGAIRYLNAMLDDRYVVGDGQGGASMVTHNSGYGIRAVGAYSALAYDWLRDAPGMTPELRKKITGRLGDWLAWYGEKGYLRDQPISNYFWGYLTTLSLAGLAAYGEAPEAEAWLSLAKDELWSKKVLPAFRQSLRGGNWPEGWQYGEYTGFEVAFVAKAFQTAAGVDLVRKLPWLGEAVDYHVQALLPDRRSVYDGGTWGEHPAKPSALSLSGIVIALEGIDDTRVAEARFMIANDLPPLRREQSWVGLLAERPGAPQRDPRKGEATSFHAPASGLTFARSDWSATAVFTSFQAGRPIAVDHQDKDQGHFVLWRGSDGLLIDGGGGEGAATINHNTLLVDDGGRHLNYTPNQGVWGHAVRTTRVGDDGVVVLAVGDIGEAYAPACVRQNCKERAVEKAVRTFVYVRPSLVVMEDRVLLEEPSYGVTWAAHTTVEPTVTGDVVSAVVGQSRVDVRALLPAARQIQILREPAGSGKGPHRMNAPWGPMWRTEISGARTLREREFLHFITVDDKSGTPPPARAITGEGLRGAVGRVDGKRMAVLFAASPEGGSIALDGAADLVAVVGLEPAARYRVELDSAANCTFKLRPAREGNGLAANAGGFLRVGASGCGKP